MSSQFEDAATAAASSPGLRATLVGGVAAMSSSASYWVDWINTGMSMLLGLFGVVAVLYGVWRQRQQRAVEVLREAREVEAQLLLIEMHCIKVAAYMARPAFDSDLGALERRP